VNWPVTVAVAAVPVSSAASCGDQAGVAQLSKCRFPAEALRVVGAGA